MKGFRLVLLAGMVAAAGCSAQQRGGVRAGDRPAQRDKVADAHFARIPPALLGGVEDVREEIRELRDDRIRAEHELSVSEQASQVATARVEASQARENVAKEALELATKTGERERIEQAQSTLELRTAERELSEANREVARRREGRSKAELDAAKGRVAAAEARLEQAKYDALVASDDAAADFYEPASFRKRIEQAQHQVQRRELDLQKAEKTLQQSISRARDLEEKLERLPVRGEDDSFEE